MWDLDNKYVQFFTDLIRKIVKQELSSLSMITTFPAIAVAINGNLVDVKIAGDDTSVLPGLKNKTGETLAVGNQVYVFALNGNLTNSYIGIKK